jgi:hypothetical protein
MCIRYRLSTLLVLVTAICTAIGVARYFIPDQPPEPEYVIQRINSAGGNAEYLVPVEGRWGSYLIWFDDPPGVGDDEARSISKNINIEQLDLCRTDITDATIKHLSAMKRIGSLSVSFTGITYKSVDDLCEIRGLEELDIIGTTLDASDIAILESRIPRVTSK